MIIQLQRPWESEGKWHYHILRCILGILWVDGPVAVIKAKRHNLLSGVAKAIRSTIHLKLNTGSSTFSTVISESKQRHLIPLLVDRVTWTDHENLYDIYMKRGKKVTFVFILLGTMKHQRIKCLSYYHISTYKPTLWGVKTTWEKKPLLPWASSSYYHFFFKYFYRVYQ